VSGDTPPVHDWKFVTNHLLVVVCIAEDPDIRMVDVAKRVGVTERAIQGIVRDLVQEGYLIRERVGRRNTYRINVDQPLRHSETEHLTLGQMLERVGNAPLTTLDRV
jgi:hypothetical protein